MSLTKLEVAGAIARLALESPPVNSFSRAFLDALWAALEALEERDDWNVLVLSSPVSVFSAGGDLQSMADWMAAENPGIAIAAYARDVQDLCRRIESISHITIAECQRSALGGGLELALACDLRIGSSRAKFGLPEVGLGLLPGAGGTQRLTRLCGRANALRLILGAEVVSASVARDLGIIQWLYDEDEFRPQCDQLAARLASMPREAVRYSKQCIVLAGRSPAADGFDAELSGIAALAGTEATRSLVKGFLSGVRRPGQGPQ